MLRHVLAQAAEVGMCQRRLIPVGVASNRPPLPSVGLTSRSLAAVNSVGLGRPALVLALEVDRNVRSGTDRIDYYQHRTLNWGDASSERFHLQLRRSGAQAMNRNYRTALLAFTRPWAQLVPVPEILSAVDSMLARTDVLVAPAWELQASAAVAATMGEDMEVPLPTS